MAMGRQKQEHQGAWISPSDLPCSPGNPFYAKLNELLAEAGFDSFVERLCEPYYTKDRGRPSVPPGVYFRMLFIGYMEGLSSQRGIAWRCSDSRSLQSFLGYDVTASTPDHSSLTVIRKRLPLEVHEDVFRFVLSIAKMKNLLKGKSVAVDSTMIEADAAMKSIVRRDTGDDWKEYVRTLMAEEGITDPTDEDIRRFDRKRKKKVSNKDWESPTDPDARIARMKDGRTHLAYKTEHAIDLDTDLLLAAEVYPADEADTASLTVTLGQAQDNLIAAGISSQIEDAVMDKGYLSTANLVILKECSIRSYIPERESPHPRRWTHRPAVDKQAVYGNRRRVRGDRGRRLSRLRSEMAERSFAHVCRTGGARRSWLRGRIEVAKRYMTSAAGKNLSVIMRALFGIGTPRTMQANGAGCGLLLRAWIGAMYAILRAYSDNVADRRKSSRFCTKRRTPLHDRHVPRGIVAAA